MGTVAQHGVGAEPAPYEAFTVEQRGIDIIPAEERHSRPINLFWIWAGAIVNIEYVVYGTFLVIFLGLSFPQALGIIVRESTKQLIQGRHGRTRTRTRTRD